MMEQDLADCWSYEATRDLKDQQADKGTTEKDDCGSTLNGNCKCTSGCRRHQTWWDYLSTQKKLIEEYKEKRIDSLEQIDKKVSAPIDSIDKRMIEVTADSGAAVSVMPKGDFNDYPLEPTLQSKLGVCYKAADGGQVNELGRRVLNVKTRAKTRRRIKFKVCDKVTKTLGSISEMIDNAQTVVFDANGSYIYDKMSYETTPMRRKNGQFVYDLEVLPYSEDIQKTKSLNAIAGDNVSDSGSKGSRGVPTPPAPHPTKRVRVSENGTPPFQRRAQL